MEKKRKKEKKKTTYKPKDFVHFSVIPNLVINNPYVFSPVSRQNYYYLYDTKLPIYMY